MTQDTTELCYLTIREAAELLRNGKLSPVELTRAFLERIEQLDDTLKAFITVLSDSAMSEARTAEAEILRGDYRGPLHGIPIALKDLYDTKGVRTTGSSKVMADRVPSEDATTTARLNAAGSILLGKLAMHEFALGGPDPTNGFPLARNPWNLDHIPGGSSSGSGAAVSAGLSMGALGSCTGGSIRGPASYCGMVGLKATYGRVSRYGVLPLSWSLDHCGPMTWTVEDTAIMLQAIAGYDPKDPTTSHAPVPDYSASLREDVKGLKIGVPRHFFFADDERINKEILSTVDTALKSFEDMGAHIEEITIPSLEYASAAQPVIMLSEAFAYHEQNLRSRPQDFGEMVRARFRIGGLFTSGEYVQAQRVRNVIKREFAEALQSVDVIVSPTSSSPPTRFDEVQAMTVPRMVSFTGPYNLTGMPAISIPCGFMSEGLPVGLQIAGKPFDEPTVLRASYAYQQQARWFEKRPAV
ncbi:MAG: Asp-tRNA(Asn)/Glu-tRNA(Gln) amidotransferase subunit GatA [Chloroflexi bacterium]|nr:Asp-tRNA(Asn)/Glu-tRNA(Gln) amidotransferase subunit GatA [Chloroflexota bacterium]